MSNSKEYMRVYMLERYTRRRQQAIRALGGKCKRCSSKDDLEFHHKSRRKSGDFVIAKKIVSVAEDRLQDELKKCVLLCKGCHVAQTAKERGFRLARGTHGTISAYRYCGPPKCEACKKAKRDHHRQWRKRTRGVDGSTPDSYSGG